MKKLHLIISIVFIMFTSNCIAMDHPSSLTSSNHNATSDMEYWSNDKEIQDIQRLIHNQYENKQFDIKQQPIAINEMAIMVSSFFNGSTFPSYVIVGIPEDKTYNYKNYNNNEEEFLKHVNELQNGIYKVTDDYRKDIHYQIINKEASKLQLKPNRTAEDVELSINNINPGDYIYCKTATLLFNPYRCNKSYKGTKTINGVEVKKNQNIQKVENTTNTPLNKYIVLTSEDDFKNLSNKEDGIYKIGDNYYQVFEGEKTSTELKLVMNYVPSGKRHHDMLSKLFDNLKPNPVNTNEIYKNESMENYASYVEKLKNELANFTDTTPPFDDYIKYKIINPKADPNKEILILTINLPEEYKNLMGYKKNGNEILFYRRTKPNKSYDYGSAPFNLKQPKPDEKDYAVNKKAYGAAIKAYEEDQKEYKTRLDTRSRGEW